MLTPASQTAVHQAASHLADELFPPATRVVTLDTFGDQLANGLTEAFVFSLDRSIASDRVSARFRLQA